MADTPPAFGEKDTVLVNEKDSIQVPAIERLAIDDKDMASSTVSATSNTGLSTPQSSVSNQDQIASDKPAAPAAEVKQPEGPIRTPFPHPLPSCKPAPRPELTTDQKYKYAAVLAAVQAWTILPTTSAKNAPTEVLSDEEKMWLSRECLLRYLRATSWVTANAVARLQNTLVWRREYGVYRFTADYISEEMATGKETVLGYDVEGRPCIYLDPGRQNTKKSDHQIEALVYMLERGIDLMHPGQDTMALLINFKNATSGGSPSVGQGRQTLAILQGHYPERLGRACVNDLPWYIATFFKLISPFIDPITKSKILFNQQLRDTHVPSSQLWKDYGGDADFEYDHSQYWPVLTKLCAERKEAQFARWAEGGKRIGEYEAFIRGGEQLPLKDVEAKAAGA